MMNKNKILSVRIERTVDTDADTSLLGKYTSTPSEWAICRYGEHQGEFVRDLSGDDSLPGCSREHRFFLPNVENYAGVDESELRKYCLQDFERMESLERGGWCYLGIIAKAEIWNPRTKVTQTIRSGGLWGIESDSDEAYLKSVGDEQLDELAMELESLGFGDRAIKHAFKSAEHVNR